MSGLVRVLVWATPWLMDIVSPRARYYPEAGRVRARSPTAGQCGGEHADTPDKVTARVSADRRREPTAIVQVTGTIAAMPHVRKPPLDFRFER